MKKEVRRIHTDARMGVQGDDDSDSDDDRQPIGQTTDSATIEPTAAGQQVDGMEKAGTDSGAEQPVVMTAIATPREREDQEDARAEKLGE